MIPWDLTIIAYNLQPVRRTELDVRYLGRDMASAKNIVLLQRHRDILLQGASYSEEQSDTALRQKEKQLTHSWHQEGPLGSTWMDWRLMHRLV